MPNPKNLGHLKYLANSHQILLNYFDWEKRSHVCRDEKQPTSCLQRGHISIRRPSRSISLGKDDCLAFGCDQLSPTKKHLARTRAGENVCYRFMDGLSWWSLFQPMETFSMFRTLSFPAGKIWLCFSSYHRPPAKRGTWMFCLCWPSSWGLEMSLPQQEGRDCPGSHIWFYISSHFSCFKQKHMAGIFRSTIIPSASALHLDSGPTVAFKVRFAVYIESGHGSVRRTWCAPCWSGGISVVSQGLVD